MSNSIGDLKNSGLKGNNFPWQLKMLEGLQKIYDEVKEPLTCAEDSVNVCVTQPIPVVIDCNDRISLCVDGNIVNGANALPVNVTNALPLEVVIDEANDSILIYGFDGTANQPVSVDANGFVNVNATFPASLPVTQDPASDPWTVDGTVGVSGISDGTDSLEINTDGSINVNATIVGPIGNQDCDNSLAVSLCSAQAQDLTDIKNAVIPTTRTPNILLATGTAIIAVPIYSITFFNQSPDPELITFDGGTTYIIIQPGISITMDAGGNNTYPANLFGYDVIGTGPILITYNS